MKTTITAAIALLSVGVAAGAVLARVGKAPANASPVAEDSRTDGDQRAGRNAALEAGRLAGEVAMLKARVAELGAAPSRAADVEPHGTADEGVHGAEQIRAKDAERRRVFLDRVAVTFRSEAVDPRWSSATTSALQAAIANPNVELHARNVECRATICRVELDPEGEAGLPRMAMTIGDDLPYMEADRGEEGEAARPLVLYLGRRPFGAEAPSQRY